MRPYLFFCFAIFVGLNILPSCAPDKTNAAPSQKKQVKVKKEERVIEIEKNVTLPPDFGKHWYQGKAELTSYELKQARYGEIHKGHAVLIYVKEDFWKNKQVKFEGGSIENDERVPVLKLNFTRKFNTGVYPYSLMTSTFSPLQSSKPLKISSTMQEWCGHTYMQVNQYSDEFRGVHHSYFQSEGDAEFTFPSNAIFEDDLWLMLRKNPKQLPTGKAQVVPGMQYLRMAHKEAKTYTAELEIRDCAYIITYPTLDRMLKIEFDSLFPHAIAGWTEERMSFGKKLTTVATQKESMMLDYWGKHSVADSVYREELGLQ